MIKVSFDFPHGAGKHWDSWIAGYTIGDIAEAVENAGFESIGMPDHPVPSQEWLAAGGHQTHDPFVALGVMGARTSRVRLLTNLAVVPYRSPYVTAKAAATLDVLCGGRVTLGLGAGYVKGEFAALEADFASRGRLFDQAIGDIREAWSGEPFVARSQRGVVDAATNLVLPRPAQRPGPPIWVGGNSARARRRVAELADGWMPFLQPAEGAAITGTDALTSIGELADQIGRLKDAARERDRVADDIDVCLGHTGLRTADDLGEFLDTESKALEEAGVTWLTWQAGARSAEACLADIEQIARFLTV